MNPLIPSERKDFRDKDVCKHFLAGFCPAEMFMNTKADLGKCGFVHDAKVQKDYQQSDDKGKLGYEEDFYDYLCRLVSDVDRTIRKGHQRLENKADAPTLAISQDELREKIIIQEETLRTQLEEVLSLGLQSSVKQALDHALLCERLLAELEALRQNDITHHSYKAEKRMEVCEVCGALLANDATGIRIDMHMVGKQHTGFIKIRETIEELKVPFVILTLDLNYYTNKL